MIVIRSSREVVRRIRDRFRSRALEWEHTVVAILWGLIVLANPKTFTGPSYAAFLALPPPWDASQIWGWMALSAGTLRLAALCINGYMAQPTAIIRAAGAVSGILLYAVISLGILFSWAWSTGLAVYPVIGFFGLFSLAWAVSDVANPDEHDEPSRD